MARRKIYTRKEILNRFSWKHLSIECSVCGIRFIKNSISTVCSLKCRVLEGCEKQENGCWIWKKLKAGDYGKLRWGSKTISSHRASYLAFKGGVANGLLVCHSCDNPLCVNPDHLWLGTYKENYIDAKNKGRTKRGEKHNWRKFTDMQVEEMRLLKKEGFTYNRLSNIFNCSVRHLSKIIKFKYRF